MATTAGVSLEEYLRTVYEPECELIGGALFPKPMGTLEHMDMERLIVRLLERYEAKGLGKTVWELSVRHGADVRVPDVVFVPEGARFVKGILMDAPLLCVEILSPSQRQSELFAKCESYHSWGVPYCWVVDPIGKTAWEYHRDAPVKLLGNEASLSAGEIAVAVADLFGRTSN